MSLPRYDSYKDSGVEWIGEIPEGWEVKKLKYVADFKSGEGITSDQIKESGDYPVYGGNGLRGYFDSFTHEGDHVLIGRQGALCGNINYADGKFWASEHAVVCTLHESYTTKWFGELLSTMNLNQYSVSAAQPGLSVDNIKVLKTPCPPLSEQTVISSFLDRKTAEIDQLIANKEKLIALYEEEKTAIINRAVTRGLDPAVKTRPSGVDWLGDIPEHWEVKRLKYVINSITGGGTPSTGNPLFWNGIIPWVSPKDMKIAEIYETEDYVTDFAVANSSTTLVAPNSILVVVRSGILKHTFPVAINRVTVCLNQDMKAIMPADCLDEKFLYWKLKGLSNIVLTVCNKMGATVDSIEVPDLLSLLVTFPQKAEQAAIVTQIETECTRLDTIIDKFKKQIELFKEYRTTLISEVVTGKIDVRGEVEV
jgi:type I restriction enzyme, S subunit